MKKIFLLAFSIVNILSSNAQITITSADMPAVGDTIRTSMAMNPESFDFTLTGEDYNWDFTGLNPISQRIDTFYTVTSTPVAFWPFFLSSADLVNTFNPANVLPGLPDAVAYRFLESSNSRYQDLGYGLTFEGTPIPLKFSDPDELYQFPMAYGQSFTDDARLELALAGLGYVLIERSRVNSIDGWGTLSTPFGTFESLRYKSVVEEYDSLYINDTGQALTRSYTEYHWLAQGMKVPLMQVTLDETAGNMVVYQDSARTITVGQSEYKTSEATLKLAPNPVDQQTSLSFDAIIAAEAVLKIFDQQGRQVFMQDIELQKGNNAFLLEAKQHLNKAGIYIIQITGKGIHLHGKMVMQ